MLPRDVQRTPGLPPELLHRGKVLLDMRSILVRYHVPLSRCRVPDCHVSVEYGKISRP